MNTHDFTVHVRIIGGDDVDRKKALMELISLLETMQALSLGKENMYSCYNRSSTYPVINNYSIENIAEMLDTSDLEVKEDERKLHPDWTWGHDDEA